MIKKSGYYNHISDEHLIEIYKKAKGIKDISKYFLMLLEEEILIRNLKL